MGKFRKEKLNPVDVLRDQFGIMCEHITYDPGLKKSGCHFQVIRQCSHDGTMLFTTELLADTLLGIANMQAYPKNLAPEFDKLVAIKYTVGPIWLSTVYGVVDLPPGSYPGERQRTRMCVVCEYVYADKTLQED
ncbi:hypothetical protein phiKPNH21_00092 [Klebsiella phage phi_KPN_H2]|nr:hypothetical protein phiKPNH21_00092 [Klebsiella phage phi_KPN_H2]